MTGGGGISPFTAGENGTNMSTEQPQTTSLLGKPLYASVARTDQDEAALEKKVADAKAAWEADPEDVQKYMLYALAIDATHEYRQGIELYEQGIERWPEEPMLYCHLGHRLLNMREFDRGLEYLNKADGMLPDSTDVLYHKGLAYYMKGEFEQALAAFEHCNRVTSDEGNVQPTSSVKLVARAEIIRMGNADWIYTTLSRLGRFDEAAAILDTVNPDLETSGNMIFYMTRVLFYQGVLSEEEVLARFAKLGRGAHSMGYGLGAHFLARGDKEKAKAYFEDVITGTMWPAWAFIASEVELARGL